jgi:hypothetical protein
VIDRTPAHRSFTLRWSVTHIYHDLRVGLVLLEKGQIENASWHWHFTYYVHWGRHLSHAQSAIWEYLSQGNWT